ncbi:MAG: hypothetical protein D6701_11030 [Gemmatimonadetes bacterium]|nr:MAG: hypothetical protein D6701_11030 [Gemmatimonadota bacterium]
MATFPLEPVHDTFRAIATTVVPEAVALDRAGWERLEEIIAEALASRPERIHRQLRLFVRIVDWRARWRHRERFVDLDPLQRTRELERIERSRWLLLRRGLWGLRTLIFMGYYAQPAIQREIGYRARPEGWDAVRGAGR